MLENSVSQNVVYEPLLSWIPWKLLKTQITKPHWGLEFHGLGLLLYKNKNEQTNQKPFSGEYFTL